MATVEDSLYNAFAKAETGGVSDPWIRTYGVPGSSSTAYGPVQITATLARDYLDRHSDLFNQEEKNYLKRFLEQGKQFIKFGREPDREGYDPRYDYGGSGDLVSDEDKAMYERVAKKMLMQHYRNNKGNLSDTIKEWRFGAASNKSRSEDERYWREVEETFVSQPDSPEEQPTETYPQISPTGFLDNLVEIMRQRLSGSQSESQAPSEARKEPEQEQPSGSNAIVQSMANAMIRRRSNEANLERTANEAQLEATAREAEGRAVGSEAIIQRLANSEVIKQRVYDRSNLNADVTVEQTEELAGGRDASKDPVFGLF